MTDPLDGLLGEEFLTHDADGKVVRLVRKESFDRAVRDLTEARTALRSAGDIISADNVARIGLAAQLLDSNTAVRLQAKIIIDLKDEARRLAEELALERSYRGAATTFRKMRQW